MFQHILLNHMSIVIRFIHFCVRIWADVDITHSVIALGEELQDQCGSQRMNVEHNFTLILLSGLNLSFIKHIVLVLLWGVCVGGDNCLLRMIPP